LTTSLSHLLVLTVRRCTRLSPQVIDVGVDTDVVDGVGIDRVVSWAGTLLQVAHDSVGDRCVMPVVRGVACPSVPYISRWGYGTPAHKYGLRASNWLLEINGEAVTDLDDLVRVRFSDGCVRRRLRVPASPRSRCRVHVHRRRHCTCVCACVCTSAPVRDVRVCASRLRCIAFRTTRTGTAATHSVAPQSFSSTATSRLH
jgi:hypothetical protein